MRFHGQQVMVVGAASGLGEAASRAFAAEGARLVLVDLDGGRLARLAADLPDGTASVAGDAADPATADAAIAAAHGAVDVLFIAAGIDPKSATDVPGTSLSDWSAVMAVNLTAPSCLPAPRCPA